MKHRKDRRKLSSEQVQEILKLRKMGVTQVRLCRDFGITAYTLYLILKGITYKEVPREE
jgi:transposase-like protein